MYRSELKSHLASLILVSLGLMPSVDVFGQEEIEFNQDIRPILSQACFRCHGQDAKTREAGLRLDMEEAALEKRESGAAFVPGKLDSSLAWTRILSTDPDSVMPPPLSNRQLTEKEKTLLKEWIEKGAKYERHWAFEPIRKSDGPVDIDSYLEKEMRKLGLEPTPVADPITVVRRLAFTLTGLPPTREEVDRFVKDPSDASYSALVEHYLASPHFGEEMAKHWLDVARYGDTHGLHLDNDRTIWAYRDWVISAFNRNLPYDQFTVEQLAGDLLPNPTTDQIIATGFNRCNVTTSEGGAINEEFLYRYAVDRTSTTIQTWLGLTGGCAVCHDHKYDPISTKEFYSLYAFFYSAADPAMDGNVTDTRPYQPLASPEQQSKLDAARKREADAQAKLWEFAKDTLKRMPFQSSDSVTPSQDRPRSVVWLDDEFPIGASTRNTSRNDALWVAADDAPMGSRYLTQAFGDKYDQFVSGGSIAKWIPEKGQLQLWVRPDRWEAPEAIYLSVQAGGKTLRWGWANTPELAKRVDVAPDKLLGKMPAPGQWTQLVVPLEGLPSHAKVNEIRFGLFGGICSWDGFVATGIPAPDQLLNDWNQWWDKQKGIDTAIVSGGIAQAVKEGRDSEAGKKHASDVETYFYAYIAEDVSPELLQLRRQWLKSRIDRATVESSFSGSMVFRDTPTPRDAFVMKRGQYDAKGEAVSPATLSVLPPLVVEEGKRPNRLHLARWLVHEQHPMTSRVAVNRFWQQVFGIGIVKTSDDFGTQGTPPTHPLLLDHLAHEFQQTGWNIKQLMKKLVTTQAFRRSAVHLYDHVQKDPENRYLARGPRTRLDAEQVRDNVLASSGILNRAMGGPGFKGYQPPNIWEPVGYGDSNTRYYIQDHGDALYKRSIYAYIKRTAPPPFMSNFDAPNREQSCSRRERSNTPLQALQLMNDVQYVEAARFLAEAMCEKKLADDKAKIEEIVQAALSRKPTDAELERLFNAYKQFQTRFEANPEDAKKLLRMGEKPQRSGLSSTEVATLTMLVNLVFNLDEFVNRN